MRPRTDRRQSISRWGRYISIQFPRAALFLAILVLFMAIGITNAVVTMSYRQEAQHNKELIKILSKDNKERNDNLIEAQRNVAELKQALEGTQKTLIEIQEYVMPTVKIFTPEPSASPSPSLKRTASPSPTAETSSPAPVTKCILDLCP